MNMKSINPDTCCSNCKRYGTTPAKFPIWCSDNDCKCHQPTMKQIPNIEEWEKKAAKVALEAHKLSKHYGQFSSYIYEVVKEHHHQLQKAREEERERIINEIKALMMLSRTKWEAMDKLLSEL